MSQTGLQAQQIEQGWAWSWGREGSGEHESFILVS